MNDEELGRCRCNGGELLPGRVCGDALSFYRRVLREGTACLDAAPPCLRALGLVADDPGAPGATTAVPPEAAAIAALRPIEEAIADQQRTYRSVQAMLSVFTRTYDDARKHEQPTLTVLTGAQVISNALEAAVDGCREELLTAQPGGGRPAHLLGEALAREVRMLARGVRQRTLYQHTVRSHAPTLAYIEQVTAAGAEVHTLVEVFERMIICDREVAFIPTSEERSDSALQIRHPALLRFLAALFDNAWARSVPVGTGDVPARSPLITSDVQRAILRAVVSGETDDSIARRMGMSRRSVAKHISRVSQQLGSGSRAQLGYLLATSGLLWRGEPARLAPPGRRF
ncbi:LuxR C-terminal-related transcriptional regulator [Streptomyces lydicus]|uniref:LuxR C-terminal-related transcriptional regulator n=1 Tax=Streptomyces lydicus TaxID=47763 RepID=UPI0036FC3295